ncbi:MAG: CPBP family intramembrane metalloprotease [Candidatus Methanoplasma sp.]|jgi:hypothetical protein|nr:CPBP family intramembrane metalloprotease [Candidatus Methanoplasma sp.]
MNKKCPNCRDFAAEGNSFCGSCGRPLAGIIPKSCGFVRTIIFALCIFVIFVAALEVLTLTVNSLGVFDFLSDKTAGFILIVPFPQNVFSLSGPMLQIYWITIAAVVILCAVYSMYRFIKTAVHPKAASEHDTPENTAFFWITVSLSAMIFINFAVVLITSLLGYETSVPSLGDKTEQMFLLADAAVWEEIITRLLYIGVPMTLISLAVTRKAKSLKCLFGGFGMSLTAVALIVISGTVFGLAHYPGWGEQTWKVLTAGIMGAFLGYIFVRFGIYATILLHFINNYMSSFDWIGIGGLGIVVSLCLIAAGLVCLYYIAVKMRESKSSIDSLPIFRNMHTEEI